MNDIEHGYNYPHRVRFEINESDPLSYSRAADFLNITDVEVVSLQFEYGIFGGESGEFILHLLSDLRMPIVTTLHTILEHPSPIQKSILDQVIFFSDRVVVMSEYGIELLRNTYEIQPSKIEYIGHGIPDLPFVDTSFHKGQFGLEGKFIILSFGLISPNKGLEYVIEALPDIVEQYPNVVYVILGATHPNVIRNEGESYRNQLHALAKKLKVEENLVFQNKYVSLEELLEHICATDIYITPYLEATQIVSGTLAYMLGAGKAVISTPYLYAKEMLASNRGVIIPFRSPKSISREVIDLLDNETKRHSMRKKAYLFGRDLIWPKTAFNYMQAFERAKEERRYFTKNKSKKNSLGFEDFIYPNLNLDHLKHLSDHTGLIQHAFFTLPNYNEGYCTDDNARAVILSTLLEENGNHEILDLGYRYLAFLWHAYNPATKRFRNFMNYQRQWLEDQGSEDCHGRALFALGTVLNRSYQRKLPSIAARLFEEALPTILETSSPRAWAFALLGIYEYLKRFSGDRKTENVRESLVLRLLKLYDENRSHEWNWFESSLNYSNGTISHAILVSGIATNTIAWQKVGLSTLKWLSEIQKAKSHLNHFVPIGSNGFFTKGQIKARFDQQPVEAQVMISAYVDAFRHTGDELWKNEAINTFEWFLGRNDLHLSLYDSTTGGCRDGLHSDRANENQGAESTLAFLQSLLEIQLLKLEK